MENTVEQMATLAKALSKAQKAMMAATKDAKNPFYNSKYATLNEVMGVLRDPLADNGLAVIQDADTDLVAKTVGVVTRIIHDSGAMIQSPRLSAPLKAEYTKDGKELPPSVQQIGSLVTYLRRYSLSSFMTVSVEDDDGNDVTQIGKDVVRPALQPAPGRTSAHTGEKLDTKEAVSRHLEAAKQSVAVPSTPRPTPPVAVQAPTPTPKAPPVEAAGNTAKPLPVSQNVGNNALTDAMTSGRITEEELERYLKGTFGVPRIKAPILHGDMTLNSLGDRIISSLLTPSNWNMVVERIHADTDNVPF